MRKKKIITLASKPTYQGYSYAFKMTILERIENGQISVTQAAKEYDCSRSAIQKWMKKYANLDKKLRELGGKSPQQRIKELEKQLRQAKQQNYIWELAMEIIQDEYGVDVKKKYLTKYQKSVLRNIKKESK